MAGFNTDNILSDYEVDNLFTDNIEEPEDKPSNEEIKEEVPVDTDTLFVDEGSQEDDKLEKEDATSDKKDESTSPNFYSSIAKSLKEDSIFPDLNPEEITDADKFAEMFEKQVQARLEEKIKRYDEAVSNGVDTNVASQYEKTLNQLNEISSEDITNEDNEDLRKNLIYIDLINKGYSKEEALEEINDILESGNDIKRAERALKSNKNFFTNKYNEEIEKSKEKVKQLEKDKKEQAESLKNDILSNNKAFGDLDVSKDYRQKAFDAISKPIYRNPENGEMLTALEKYQLEHKNDFLKNLGLLFVLTDNFTNINNLVKDKVNKASKKAIRELENTLSNTRRNSDGNLNFLGGNDDTESIFKNYSIDI